MTGFLLVGTNEKVGGQKMAKVRQKNGLNLIEVCNTGDHIPLSSHISNFLKYYLSDFHVS